MRASAIPPSLWILSLFWACERAPTTSPDVLAPSLGRHAAAAPITVSGVGFEVPESALHDPRADVYLVSNIGAFDPASSPLLLDNNGFISRLSPDGSVIALRWIEGTSEHPLHGPTGIALLGNTLYVVDRDAVKLYDRRTGAWLGAIPAPAGASLLNDICVGQRKTLYVTDTGLSVTFAPTGSDAIYKIRNGVVSVLAAGTHLNLPNGCTTAGGSVIATSFNTSGELYRVSSSGNKSLVAQLPAGNGQNDSALKIRGKLYVTSWEASAVLRVSARGQRVTKVLDLATPADLGYDAKRGRLLVPSFAGNVLVIQPIGHPGGDDDDDDDD